MRTPVFCDACGSPQAFISMGSAMICRQCEPDVRTEIDRLRAAGEPVNVQHIARRILRETNAAGTYYLRDIPDGLWKAVQHRAVDDGINLRELVLRAIQKYVAEDVQVVPKMEKVE